MSSHKKYETQLELLKKVSGKLEVKNADDRKHIPVRKSVLISPEFKALWDRIKHKTTYRVQFDNEKLIERCIEALDKAPAVSKTRLQWKKAGMSIGKAGVDASLLSVSEPIALYEADIELPDVLTELQDRTHLTRKTIARILTESTRLNDFKRNPQQFIELASDAISRCKRLYVVVETKGSLFDDELRDREGGKIKCGAAHFTALASEADAARYVVARSVEDVFAKAEAWSQHAGRPVSLRAASP